MGTLGVDNDIKLMVKKGLDHFDIRIYLYMYTNLSIWLISICVFMSIKEKREQIWIHNTNDNINVINLIYILYGNIFHLVAHKV